MQRNVWWWRGGGGRGGGEGIEERGVEEREVEEEVVLVGAVRAPRDDYKEKEKCVGRV